MKTKISENSITFKITEDEMQRLLSDLSLETKITIGQSNLCMVIDLNAHDYFDDFKEVPLRLIPDRSEACIMFCTTPEEIQKLADMGKDRNGLSMKMGDLDICLQVDVRNDSRPRKA